MTIAWPAKTPADILDFSLDWRLQMALAAPADTLATVVWTVPDELTVESQANTSTVATVWLSGGVAGANYPVACKVTTDGGRTIERTVYLPIRTPLP